MIKHKIAILFDGTSSAGKSYTAKQLKAVPFYEAVNPNQWVVIDSDMFQGFDNEGEERRLKLDHPNIRDWAKGNDLGITSGIYRKDGVEGIPENPYETERPYKGGDSRAWYMAEAYLRGPWEKVIFDSISNDVLKYVPNIKSILLHAPINVLMKNIDERNKREEEKDHRNPRTPLDQYLEKYEATTTKPDLTVGDPTANITKKELKTKLMDAMTDMYPDYDEEYIDGFIEDLGVKVDNINYWVKVKDNYLTCDQILINY